MWRHLVWVALTKVVVGIYKRRLCGLWVLLSYVFRLFFAVFFPSWTRPLCLFDVFASTALLRPGRSFVAGMWARDCAVVYDDGSFYRWRVSRSILLFREGLLSLRVGGRLGPIINIILIHNVNRV